MNYSLNNEISSSHRYSNKLLLKICPHGVLRLKDRVLVRALECVSWA